MAKRSRLGVKQDAAALADSLDVSPIEGNADIKLKQNDKQTCKLHPYHDLGPVQTEQLRSALLNWFWTYGRRLPWRGDPPPYSSASSTRDAVLRKQQAALTTWFPVQSETAVNGSSMSKKVTTQCEDNPVLHHFKRSAYSTWVSEIMLQQTQVAVVIPYWIAWITKWPTVLALARASHDDVCAVWSGLGYYQRALRLLAAAKQMVLTWAAKCSDQNDAIDSQNATNCTGRHKEQRRGSVVPQKHPNIKLESEEPALCCVEVIAKDIQSRRGEDWDIPFPRTSDAELMEYKGIGRYTAGAILSIAFGQAVPAVDGNVIRVVSRCLGFAQSPTSAILQNTVYNVIRDWICRTHPGDFNQALMDLGATVCTPRSPTCGICPLQPFCRAYQETTEKIRDIRAELHQSTLGHLACKVCNAEYEKSALTVSSYPLLKRSTITTANLNVSPQRIPEQQHTAYVIYTLARDTVKFLFVVRPKGLLGAQWGPMVLQQIVPPQSRSKTEEKCSTATLYQYPPYNRLIERLALQERETTPETLAFFSPREENGSFCKRFTKKKNDCDQHSEQKSNSTLLKFKVLGHIRHVFSHVIHDVTVTAALAGSSFFDDVLPLEPERYRCASLPKADVYDDEALKRLGLVSAYMKKIMKIVFSASLF